MVAKSKKVIAREGALIQAPSRYDGHWIPLVIARKAGRSHIFSAFAFRPTPTDPSEWTLLRPADAVWCGLTHDGAILDGTWIVHPSPKGFDRDLYNIPILTAPGPDRRHYLSVLDDRNPNRTVSMSIVDWDEAQNYPSEDLYDPWILKEKPMFNAAFDQ